MQAKFHEMRYRHQLWFNHMTIPAALMKVKMIPDTMQTKTGSQSVNRANKFLVAKIMSYSESRKCV